MLPAQRNELTAPEAPRSRFRKLRIAWSVAWGCGAVLLVVLWVRSYWIDDTIYSHHISIKSNAGTAELMFTPTFSYGATFKNSNYINNFLGDPRPFEYVRELDVNGVEYTRIHVPHWFLILGLSTFVSTPWVHFQRFSLRTLLIATTLVAVGLGLIVYAVRS